MADHLGLDAEHCLGWTAQLVCVTQTQSRQLILA